MRIVGGKFRGKNIKAPLHEGTRPTADRTREMIFNVLFHNPAFGPDSVIDKSVLDVFAGTGALGLEALSRGAKAITFIEQDKTALSILCANAQAFDIPGSCILEQDVLHLQGSPKSSYDLVFLDPPYYQGLLVPSLTQLLKQGWLSQDAVLVLEMAKNESFSLPSFLALVIERLSGPSKVLFCRKT